MILKYIWRWGSRSGALESLSYLFVNLPPRSIWLGVIVHFRVLSIWGCFESSKKDDEVLIHYKVARRCQWCNGYRRTKWTRQHEFKFWTRLIAFLIALIPLGKVWIQLFSLQLWVNSRVDWVLQPWLGN